MENILAQPYFINYSVVDISPVYLYLLQVQHY